VERMQYYRFWKKIDIYCRIIAHYYCSDMLLREVATKRNEEPGFKTWFDDLKAKLVERMRSGEIVLQNMPELMESLRVIRDIVASQRPKFPTEYWPVASFKLYWGVSHEDLAYPTQERTGPNGKKTTVVALTEGPADVWIEETLENMKTRMNTITDDGQIKITDDQILQTFNRQMEKALNLQKSDREVAKSMAEVRKDVEKFRAEAEKPPGAASSDAPAAASGAAHSALVSADVFDDEQGPRRISFGAGFGQQATAVPKAKPEAKGAAKRKADDEDDLTIQARLNFEGSAADLPYWEASDRLTGTKLNTVNTSITRALAVERTRNNFDVVKELDEKSKATVLLKVLVPAIRSYNPSKPSGRKQHLEAFVKHFTSALSLECLLPYTGSKLHKAYRAAKCKQMLDKNDFENASKEINIRYLEFVCDDRDDVPNFHAFHDKVESYISALMEFVNKSINRTDDPTSDTEAVMMLTELKRLVPLAGSNAQDRQLPQETLMATLNLASVLNGSVRGDRGQPGDNIDWSILRVESDSLAVAIATVSQAQEPVFRSFWSHKDMAERLIMRATKISDLEHAEEVVQALLKTINEFSTFLDELATQLLDNTVPNVMTFNDQHMGGLDHGLRECTKILEKEEADRTHEETATALRFPEALQKFSIAVAKVGIKKFSTLFSTYIDKDATFDAQLLETVDESGALTYIDKVFFPESDRAKAVVKLFALHDRLSEIRVRYGEWCSALKIWYDFFRGFFDVSDYLTLTCFNDSEQNVVANVTSKMTNQNRAIRVETKEKVSSVLQSYSEIGGLLSTDIGRQIREESDSICENRAEFMLMFDACFKDPLSLYLLNSTGNFYSSMLRRSNDFLAIPGSPIYLPVATDVAALNTCRNHTRDDANDQILKSLASPELKKRFDIELTLNNMQVTAACLTWSLLNQNSPPRDATHEFLLKNLLSMTDDVIQVVKSDWELQALDMEGGFDRSGLDLSTILGHARSFNTDSVAKKFFRAVLDMTRLVANDAIEKIPTGFETWVSQKDITSIRSKMFDNDAYRLISAGHGNVQAALSKCTYFTQELDNLSRQPGQNPFSSAALLGEQRRLGPLFSRLQVYCMHVQGTNLILNTMPGQSKMQKAARLRQFKVTCQTNGVKIPPQLLTWLQEAVSAA